MKALFAFFIILSGAQAQSKISFLNGQAPYAALKIDLAKGYKTYSRVAGESGLTPEFKWEGSKNLKTIEVLWPAPQRFYEGALYFWGYEASLVLPLKITALDTTQPVELALQLDYAICSNICLPQKASISLKLAHISSLVITDALEKVPVLETNDIHLVETTPTQLTFTLPSLDVRDIVIESESDYIFAPPKIENGQFSIQNTQAKHLTFTFLRENNKATYLNFKGNPKK
jgi:DsbC/DsbD-like thiol-disulfide interchange protein